MKSSAPSGNVIALVLAIGICTALNILVIGVAVEALFYHPAAGDGQSWLGENTTQILTGWGGGILSVIGAVVGYQVGVMQERTRQVDEFPAEDPNPN